MEYVGEWWIAGTDNKNFGTLSLKDDEYILEVYDKNLLSLGRYDEGNLTIHGFTKDGKKINLFGFLNVGSSFNFNGEMIHKKYKGKRIFITESKNYDSMEEIKIKTVRFRCDYLEEWVGKTLASQKRYTEIPGKMQIDIKPIDNESYKIDDFELEFCFGYNSNMNNTFTDFTWQQKNSILINFDTEKNLNEVMDLIYNLCDFLSFCIGNTVKYREIICEDINNGKINIVDSDTDGSIKNVDNLEIIRSLVLYNDIKDNFANVIKRWVLNKDKLQPIISKIISCEKDSKTFIVQINFVDIVTAMETFSRRFMNNSKMEESEYNDLIEKMLNSIDDEGFKEKMTRKLAYSNEPSLYDRLENIFDKFPDIINISNKKRNSLIYKSVNTRNYYTHFGEDNKSEKRLTGIKALYSYEVYKIILKLLILEELGLDTNKIVERQNNVHNSNFRYINMFQKEFNKPKE